MPAILRLHARVAYANQPTDGGPGGEGGGGAGGGGGGGGGGGTSDVPSWKVTLYGSVLGAGEAAGLAPAANGGEAAPSTLPPRSFLASIRRVRVEAGLAGHDWTRGPAVPSPLGSSAAGGRAPSVLTWSRSAAVGGSAAAAAAAAGAHHDAAAALPSSLVVGRAGSASLDLRFTVEADGYAERVRPSPTLAGVLGSPAPLTRVDALRGVWAYIASKGLYKAAAAPGVIALDPLLRAVFASAAGGGGGGTLAVADLAPALVPHLAPCPPPAFIVPVRPSARSEPVTLTWDLEVDAPSPVPAVGGGGRGGAADDAPSASAHPPAAAAADRALAAFHEAFTRDPAILAADAALALALRRLREHARRRAFYLGFAADPAAFIDGLAAAQARDLRAVGARGGGAPGGGAGVGMAGSAIFAGAWVDEVVGRMLQRRSAAGQ